MTDREILLGLLAGICLCDHMGDVLDQTNKVCKLLGIEQTDEDWPDCLWNALADMGGVKTLYGSEVKREG